MRFGRHRKVLILLLLAVFCYVAVDVLFYVPLYGSSNVNLTITSPLIQPIVGKDALFLLMLVTSKPSSFKRRQVFRQTMGSLENSPVSRWKMVFNLGRYTRSDGDVEEEASKYKDMLVGNFRDTYNNLIIKTFTAFRWAARAVNCKFVLKADDDVYVHLPRLIGWLQLVNRPRDLYAGVPAEGTHVERWPWQTYFISYKTYGGIEKGQIFHTYCRGPFYVLSHNLLGAIWNATKVHEPFPIEDAYVGVLLNGIGIKPLAIPKCNWKLTSFNKLKAQDECFYKDAICAGHMMDDRKINYAHERFKYNQTKALSECGENHTLATVRK